VRSFRDLDAVLGRVPAAVVVALRDVDIGRGAQALFRRQLPSLLTELAQRARVQSITASSALEGIVVPSAARAARIIDAEVGVLRTRDEKELAGYRTALDYVFRDDWRPLNVGLLLHVHRLLFSETDTRGGSLKSADNLVVDRSPDGAVRVRFVPVPAAATADYLAELIERYTAAQRELRHHPVLLVGLFVLDLLVIHPFEDGNGRVARALTNALLLDAGYEVCQWVSLEQAIADTADAYYSSLLASTQHWHEDDADPWPWLTYFTAVVAGAYRTFARRAAAERLRGTKQERVQQYVLDHAAPTFRMADVRAALPGVSDQTIRLVLDRLKSSGRVVPDGAGRAAAWRRLPTQA